MPKEAGFTRVKNYQMMITSYVLYTNMANSVLSAGLPVPKEAVPRIGFVSGTKENNW
jgi:hypothetical protein